MLDRCLGWQGVCIEPNPHLSLLLEAGLRLLESMTWHEFVWYKLEELMFLWPCSICWHLTYLNFMLCLPWMLGVVGAKGTLQAMVVYFFGRPTALAKSIRRLTRPTNHQNASVSYPNHQIFKYLFTFGLPPQHMCPAVSPETLNSFQSTQYVNTFGGMLVL